MPKDYKETSELDIGEIFEDDHACDVMNKVGENEPIPVPTEKIGAYQHLSNH